MIAIKGGQKPKRNQPCPCGSKLKFKHCHGDPLKMEACNHMVRQYMLNLIMSEKLERGMICKHGIETGKKCVDCSGPQELNLGEETCQN